MIQMRDVILGRVVKNHQNSFQYWKVTNFESEGQEMVCEIFNIIEETEKITSLAQEMLLLGHKDI
jgi:hypothetical protein